MTDPGDGQVLLGGGGGEECAGAAEEDLPELPALELVQQLRAQHHGAASAPGAACVDVLPNGIVDQISAVRQLSTDGDAILPAKPHQRLQPDGSQIPRDDEIIVLRRGFRILKMRPDGVKRSGGRCQG